MSGPRFVAKKRFGQHFLVDENLLGVIGRLAGLSPDDCVLEIGPGLGVLTAYLAKRVNHVDAVELDRALEPRLRERLAGCENVSLHFGDALTLDLAAIAPAAAKLVANLPYNIATPLIVESLDGLPQIELWCVMLQREVAGRLFASPGSKAYGAVSVLMQLATVKRGFHPVSSEAFRPRPRVSSALVAFERRPLPEDYARIKRLVGGAFAHRRKMLANSLAVSGLVSREAAEASLEQIGRDRRSRAEELEPTEFVALAEALS
ncbi:MAG: 16S rRNA (adenine(1518)-N(6)/adenine(1519)-N(6))-dimethyltransferase RsmA [Gaiellaceae bacterium]